MKRSYLVRSVIVVLCLLISLWQTEFSLPLLWERGHYFIDTVGRMFPPDTSFLDVILVPLRDTVYISLLGTVFFPSGNRFWRNHRSSGDSTV